MPPYVRPLDGRPQCASDANDRLVDEITVGRAGTDRIALAATTAIFAKLSDGDGAARTPFEAPTVGLASKPGVHASVVYAPDCIVD